MEELRIEDVVEVVEKDSQERLVKELKRALPNINHEEVVAKLERKELVGVIALLRFSLKDTVSVKVAIECPEAIAKINWLVYGIAEDTILDTSLAMSSVKYMSPGVEEVTQGLSIEFLKFLTQMEMQREEREEKRRKEWQEIQDRKEQTEKREKMEREDKEEKRRKEYQEIQEKKELLERQEKIDLQEKHEKERLRLEQDWKVKEESRAREKEEREDRRKVEAEERHRRWKLEDEEKAKKEKLEEEDRWNERERVRRLEKEEREKGRLERVNQTFEEERGTHKVLEDLVKIQSVSQDQNEKRVNSLNMRIKKI